MRGPGFGPGAYDSARKSIHKYNITSFSRHTGPFLRDIAVYMHVNSCTHDDSLIEFGRIKGSLFTLPCTFGAILVDVITVESRTMAKNLA